MTNLILLLITIIPSIMICIMFYLFDKKRESTRLTVKLFLCGFLSVIIVITISNLLFLVFPDFNLDLSNYEKYNSLQLILYTIFGIGLIEEGSKWIFTYIVGTKGEEFDQCYDAVVYAVVVSLGFALIENVNYVLEGGAETALLRCVTAIPAHLSFALFMGYFMGIARHEEANDGNYIKYIALSIFVPILLHGIYNFIALEFNSYLAIYIYLIIVLILGIILTIRVRNLPDIKIERKKYCLRCGKKVNGKICECGNDKVIG